MRLIPLKSTDEIVREYEKACLDAVRVSRRTLRIPGALLLLAGYIAFVAFVGVVVRYGFTDADGGTGNTTYQGVGPHSDAGDNNP